MILRSNLRQSGIVDGPKPYQGADAAKFDNGAMVAVASRWGRIEVQARVTDEVMPGSVGLNQHWGHKGGWRTAVAAGGARYNDLAPNTRETMDLASHRLDAWLTALASRQTKPVAKHDFRLADCSRRKRCNRASLHQPAAMHPDEQAWLHPVSELADRAAHEVRAGRGMDRNIFISAGDIIDRVHRNPNKAAGTAQPELGLIGWIAFTRRA